MNELDALHYDDVMADFSMAIVQYGARKVLQDFAVAYPALFHEMVQQLSRQQQQAKVPALCKPVPNA